MKENPAIRENKEVAFAPGKGKTGMMEQKEYLWDERRISLRDMLVEPFEKLIKTLKYGLILSAVLTLVSFFISEWGIKGLLARLPNGMVAALFGGLMALLIAFVFHYILSFFVISLWWCVVYVLDGTVKTAAELQEGTGLLMLGDIQLGRKSKREQLARRILFGKNPYSLEEETAILCNRILAICKKQQIPQIVLGGELSEKENGYIKRVAELLEQKGVSVRICENFSRSTEGIAATIKKQEKANIILLVALRRNTYEKLSDELRFCRWQESRLMGYIAIGE